METVQAILNWRDKEMPYAELPGGDGSTLDRIIQYHRGVCRHASYMSATLAGANGMPAFVMGGDLLPEKDGAFTNADTSHGWISVKLPGRGWTEVETLHAESFYIFSGINNLRFVRQETREENGERTSL